MTPIAAAYALAISVVTFILVSAIVEAMKTRGFDPVGRISALFAPGAMSTDANGQVSS